MKREKVLAAIAKGTEEPEVFLELTRQHVRLNLSNNYASKKAVKLILLYLERQ